ncbi:MAG TPA: DUF4291 domain-containing protein [Polyangiaceae bacterium]|nr:DUF4291 domain-containing protein [Polyangiaceae bacterium]
MTLELEPYLAQQAHWPAAGRHILAQFDDETVVVYQAYALDIGLYAAKHGRFGPGFSFTRMSWIKPNFLWMMFRSGWGTKEGQEVTLAIRMQRAAFDAVILAGVPTSFDPKRFASEAEWRSAGDAASVRLQWDPDHDPSGAPLERRAIQLGIRGKALNQFATHWIHSIEDISALVADQRNRPLSELLVPRERVYPMPTAGSR